MRRGSLNTFMWRAVRRSRVMGAAARTALVLAFVVAASWGFAPALAQGESGVDEGGSACAQGGDADPGLFGVAAMRSALADAIAALAVGDAAAADRHSEEFSCAFDRNVAPPLASWSASAHDDAVAQASDFTEAVAARDAVAAADAGGRAVGIVVRAAYAAYADALEREDTEQAGLARGVFVFGLADAGGAAMDAAHRAWIESRSSSAAAEALGADNLTAARGAVARAAFAAAARASVETGANASLHAAFAEALSGSANVSVVRGAFAAEAGQLNATAALAEAVGDLAAAGDADAARVAWREAAAAARVALAGVEDDARAEEALAIAAATAPPAPDVLLRFATLLREVAVTPTTTGPPTVDLRVRVVGRGEDRVEVLASIVRSSAAANRSFTIRALVGDGLALEPLPNESSCAATCTHAPSDGSRSSSLMFRAPAFGKYSVLVVAAESESGVEVAREVVEGEVRQGSAGHEMEPHQPPPDRGAPAPGALVVTVVTGAAALSTRLLRSVMLRTWSRR